MNYLINVYKLKYIFIIYKELMNKILQNNNYVKQLIKNINNKYQKMNNKILKLNGYVYIH